MMTEACGATNCTMMEVEQNLMLTEACEGYILNSIAISNEHEGERESVIALI